MFMFPVDMPLLIGCERHVVRCWFLQSKSTIIIVPLTKPLSIIAGDRQIEHLCRSWVRQDQNTKNTVPSEIGLVFHVSSKDSRWKFSLLEPSLEGINFIFLNIGFIIRFSGDIFWHSFHDYILLNSKGNICINWSLAGLFFRWYFKCGFNCWFFWNAVVTMAQAILCFNVFKFRRAIDNLVYWMKRFFRWFLNWHWLKLNFSWLSINAFFVR